MNTFANAVLQPTLDRGYTRTENGMKSLKSTLNAGVDLFGSIGAMRGKNVIPAFEAAFAENPDVAMRIAQYARDVRGGQGERKIFRDIMLHLEATRPDILLESRVLDNVAEIGRYDDLLIFKTSAIQAKALGIFIEALRQGNGLAAKWAPRKGPIAIMLREAMGLTPKRYRKLVVNATNVVETNMCNREFDSINFSHVPSVAMSRYMTAFHRNAPEAFTAFKEALKRDDGTAKVNAGAVYPYDIVRMLGGAYAYHYGYGRNAEVDGTVANKMWEALPDYMNDTAVLPMVDVSGSMHTSVGSGGKVTALDVAVSLGLYCSERSKNPAFKDLFLTFSGSPEFVKTSGTLQDRIKQMSTASWDMNTNLHAAFEAILQKSVQARVPEAEMPKMLLILSDMQFDQCARYDDSALQMVRRKYEAAGYTMPAVVFWNLNDRGDKPVRFNERGVALVSGFSPAIMKSVLAADLDKFSPENVMLQTVMVDRYSW